MGGAGREEPWQRVAAAGEAEKDWKLFKRVIAKDESSLRDTAKGREMTLNYT